MKFVDKSNKAHFNYFKELGNIVDIDGSDKVIELFKEYQKTKSVKIKNRIIESHLKLVVRTVNNFVNQVNDSIYDDLINEGNLGLLEAFEKFDCDNGKTSFATYAGFYIYKNIFNFSNNTTKVVTQQDFWNVKKAIRDIADDLRGKTNDEPSVNDIIDNYNQLPKKAFKLTQFKYNEIFNLSKPVKSFDQPISGTDENLTLSCVIGQEDKQSFDNTEIFEKLKEVLSEKEFTVVDMHLGLTTREALTFQQIGPLIGYTPGRVSQFYSGAIKKLQDRKDILVELF